MATTLYRFYDAGDQLLYIGIAGNPGRRYDQHAKDKAWWSDVARSTMEHYDNRGQAAAAEIMAIRNEAPLHNIAHNRGERLGRNPAQIHWCCDVCRQTVRAGDGYVQIDRDGNTWQVLHRSCDPDINSTHYWWGTERLTTNRELIGFESHVAGKAWVDETALTSFVDRHIIADRGHR